MIQTWALQCQTTTAAAAAAVARNKYQINSGIAIVLVNWCLFSSFAKSYIFFSVAFQFVQPLIAINSNCKNSTMVWWLMVQSHFHVTSLHICMTRASWFRRNKFNCTSSFSANYQFLYITFVYPHDSGIFCRRCRRRCRCHVLAFLVNRLTQLMWL